MQATVDVKQNCFVTNPVVIKQLWNVEDNCNKTFRICLSFCGTLWNVESNDFNSRHKMAFTGN